MRGQPGFQTGMQRHHLLPRQLLTQNPYRNLFDAIGRDRIGFDDFRSNGLLLPSTDESAERVRMPLHRGPHRTYNAMVAERVGQIEAAWSDLRLRAPEIALDQALMRLDLLQRALRRRLLAEDRTRLKLNRRDRLGEGVDFADLDAMAEALWAGTAVIPDLPPDILVLAHEQTQSQRPEAGQGLPPLASTLPEQALMAWIFG